jgi:hypothetical protein
MEVDMERFYLPIFKGAYILAKPQNHTVEAPLYTNKIFLARDIKSGELYGTLDYVLEIDPPKGTVTEITKNIATIIAELYEDAGATPSSAMQILLEECGVEFEEYDNEDV